MPASSPQGDSGPTPDETRIVPSAGPARTLYADTVRRQRERLLVQQSRQSSGEGRETLAAHPVVDLDAVVLVGRGAHVTTPALRFCLRRDLRVLLLSRHGKLQGFLADPDPGRVDVRRVQYAATQRTERRVP
jgi:CRISPR/Cas system-associated endonuclease Cas1